jgi:hypothetical protein
MEGCVYLKETGHKGVGRIRPTTVGTLILTVALGRGVYSASNRNEYRKQKNNFSGELSASGA